MSSMTFGQKSFTPVPPDKGSFPLDHEGHCKKFMCRKEAKTYLECRMENNLMKKEDFATLGFSDLLTEKNKPE